MRILLNSVAEFLVGTSVEKVPDMTIFGRLLMKEKADSRSHFVCFFFYRSQRVVYFSPFRWHSISEDANAAYNKTWAVIHKKQEVPSQNFPLLR